MAAGGWWDVTLPTGSETLSVERDCCGAITDSGTRRAGRAGTTSAGRASEGHRWQY